MTVLVYAEHDNQQLKGETAKLVFAAQQLGEDINVLVAGENCGAVAEQASSLTGVNKVLVADNAVYANQLAENIADMWDGTPLNYGETIRKHVEHEGRVHLISVYRNDRGRYERPVHYDCGKA